MPGSGTSTFIDPDDYQASLGHLRIDLLVTSQGAFNAHLTWARTCRRRSPRPDRPSVGLQPTDLIRRTASAPTTQPVPNPRSTSHSWFVNFDLPEKVVARRQ